MKQFLPFQNSNPISATVIDLAEEKRIEGEVVGIVELYDFMKAHPDTAVREIARFMPPVDSRVVGRAIQQIALRDAKRKSAL